MSGPPVPQVLVVGAGNGDPGLLTVRAAEALGRCALVVCAPGLDAVARALAPAGVPVLDAAPTSWPRPGPSAWLVAGRGDDRAVLAQLRTAGARVDVLAGLDAATVAAVDAALPDLDDARPLRGRRVLVTRAAEQAGELSGPLRHLGAEVVELPTIRIAGPADGGRALRGALAELAPGDWLVLTSPNGARRALDQLPDARRLAGVHLAAIGPATAAVLAAAHLPADLVPERYVAEALLDVFPPPPPSGGPHPKVVLARAAVARDVLPDGLRARGWAVEVVEAYRTEAAGVPAKSSAALGDVEVACFTAPSTFQRFLALGLALPPVIACIGPVTAGAVRAAGVEPAIVAEVHTIPGLVDALAAWARRR